jgi:multidrug efflux system membrane fusion protein
VKTFRVGKANPAAASVFAGEVQARYQTPLAFRVTGKISRRAVDIGDTVRKGQLLAQLDNSDFQLAVLGLQAQLKAATAERDFALADLRRYRELLQQRVISAPEFDRHDTAYTAAQAKVNALQAQLEQAQNQVHYTDLLADRDGVVLAVAAESGQVVRDGQTIVTLAQQNDKEIHFDIPEQQVTTLREQQSLTVALWSNSEFRFQAKIREIAAAAEATSRTYRVKATLLEGLKQARLGMTASVFLPAARENQLAVPLSAVFSPQQSPQQTQVWLVDEQSLTVKAQAVQVGNALGDGQVAVTGINAGQLLVSAGVQRLSEGQSVRLLDKDAQP